MSQQQDQPAENRPSNPFGGSSGRPFGGSTSGQSSTPPRPAGLSRFAAARVHWRIAAVSSVLVRFDLDGLGDPFHRVLGAPLSLEYGNPDAVIGAIEGGGPRVNDLENRLEDAWAAYKLHGAVLLHAWRAELPAALSGTVPAGEDDEPESFDDDKPAPPRFLRALDIPLVLNVLARTRSGILLGRAPLALERDYLAASLFTDDPRLVALARATGCIEEMAAR